jgi:hypothetical protein
MTSAPVVSTVLLVVSLTCDTGSNPDGTQTLFFFFTSERWDYFAFNIFRLFPPFPPAYSFLRQLEILVIDEWDWATGQQFPSGGVGGGTEEK